MYSRQSGKWGQFVSGLNGTENLAEFERLSPVRNIQDNFPPTLLIHGNKDKDVPFSQSVKLSKELDKKNIDYQFIEMNGFGHMFDKFEGGLENQTIENTFNKLLKFLKEHR